MSTATIAEKRTDSKETAPKADQYSIGYIPAVDGLRAVSILLVITSHEIGPVTSEFGHKFNGWIGVDVFFVISGFLITSILLKESAKKGGTTDSGKFSLGRFYLRRWLRICPAYYIYLAVVAGWYMMGGDHHLKPFVCAALYLTNLDIAYSWGLIPMKPFLTHLWSLGLEEQFYLIWPACMKVLKKHAVTAVAMAITAVYFWRLYLVAHGATWFRIFNGLDSKIDVLLAGVLVALLLSKDSICKVAGKTLGNPIAQIALAVSAFQAFQWLGHPSAGSTNDQLFFWAVKMPATTGLIAAVLISILTGSSGPIARILSNPIPVFVGKLSYSLYLWHPLVHILYCAYFWDFFCKHARTAELYQYGLIFACACISYFVIELPFLKLKSRFN
ncbi:MAG: acyltransferase [Candidatus Obscuribacterales bacterium]|nr:acyltransferase [Candidatus Obscuribacterales bacterium]